MSTAPHASDRAGASGVTLLTIAFIVLKLTHVIDWSWWWVLSPTWIPLAILLAFILIGFPVFILFKKVKKS